MTEPVVIDQDLEAAIREAVPSRCEVLRLNDELCGATPAWSGQFTCNCPDDDIALICDRHIDGVRTSDYVCACCLAPITLMAVRQL